MWLQCKSTPLNPLQRLRLLKPCSEYPAKASRKLDFSFLHLVTQLHDLLSRKRLLSHKRFHLLSHKRLRLGGLLHRKHRNQRKGTAKRHPLPHLEPLERDQHHRKERDDQATHQTLMMHRMQSVELPSLMNSNGKTKQGALRTLSQTTNLKRLRL